MDLLLDCHADCCFARDNVDGRCEVSDRCTDMVAVGTIHGGDACVMQ
jgi:hypothetical protein